MLAQGREATKDYIKENKKFAKNLEEEIRKAVTAGKKLPKEIGEEKE